MSVCVCAGVGWMRLFFSFALSFSVLFSSLQRDAPEWGSGVGEKRDVGCLSQPHPQGLVDAMLARVIGQGHHGSEVRTFLSGVEMAHQADGKSFHLGWVKLAADRQHRRYLLRGCCVRNGVNPGWWLSGGMVW